MSDPKPKRPDETKLANSDFWIVVFAFLIVLTLYIFEPDDQRTECAGGTVHEDSFNGY